MCAMTHAYVRTDVILRVYIRDTSHSGVPSFRERQRQKRREKGQRKRAKDTERGKETERKKSERGKSTGLFCGFTGLYCRSIGLFFG